MPKVAKVGTDMCARAKRAGQALGIGAGIRAEIQQLKRYVRLRAAARETKLERLVRHRRA